MSPFLYPQRMTSDWETQVKAQIKRRYAAQAKGPSSDGATKAIAAGYPRDLIETLPPALVASYSGCGYMFEGYKIDGDETVIDLGAGAGLDSFIAAQHLDTGQIISVDMTFEMLANTAPAKIKSLCADIEYLPLENACADLVIANASLNLAISKERAFSEAFRILKPGGRLIARDLIKTEELPAEVLTDPLSFNTSLGGALEETVLIVEIEKAGFADISISDHRPFSYAHSVKIGAIKPS